MPGDPVPHLPPLLEAALGVGSELELRTTLQRIVDGAAELTGARYATLRTADPGQAGPDRVAAQLLTTLRRALDTAARRRAVSRIEVTVDATAPLTDGRAAVRLTVYDDGNTEAGEDTEGTTVTWQAPL
ncbi:hypothetical protein [Streptomyces sp. NPDC001250]|uniref:hypothetical protein n=1 Tax=unclassified Streptomyces TaxID=2593676 RepID=UPI00332B2A56